MLKKLLAKLQENLMYYARVYYVWAYSTDGYVEFRRSLARRSVLEEPIEFSELIRRCDTINHKLLLLQSYFSKTRYQQILATTQKLAAYIPSQNAFVKLVNVKRRDVIYGCWEARIAYTHLFASHQQRLAIDHQRFMKTDTLNDSTWRHDAMKPALIAPNSASRRLAIVMGHLTGYGEVITPEDRQQAQRFYQGLESHPRYSPARMAQGISDHDSQEVESILRDKKASSDSLEEAAYNKQTRRACKYGIEFALKAGRHVHFLLDGLMEDLDSAIHHKITTQERCFITISELLFVQREWYRWIRATNRLHFYLGGMKVQAPWEGNEFDTENIFAQYNMHRITKYVTMVPNGYKKVGRILIEKFHPDIARFILGQMSQAKNSTARDKILLTEIAKLPNPLKSYIAQQLKSLSPVSSVKLRAKL